MNEKELMDAIKKLVESKNVYVKSRNGLQVTRIEKAEIDKHGRLILEESN